MMRRSRFQAVSPWRIRISVAWPCSSRIAVAAADGGRSPQNCS